MSKSSSVVAVVVALLVGAAGGYGIQTYLAKSGMTGPGMAGSSMSEPEAADTSEESQMAAEGEGAGEEGDPIAIVNGQNLYESDLVAFLQRLPPQLQAQAQMLMPQILEQVVNNELATQAGHNAGLAQDAEVMSQLGKVEDLIVGQTYLQRAIDEQVTDEKLEAAYQKYLEENPPKRELKARHILVETEDEAKGVIADLDGGADFAELAKEKSTGPSGANGGELPPFQEGQMVPEFSDAAFAMEVGSYSKEPVKTQFGYHIILLEESSMTEPPTKEAVESELRDQLSQEAAEAVIAELREGAEIEVLFGQPKDEATPEAGGEAESAPENN